MNQMKIERMGDKHLGVKLLGDPAKPEPTYFSVKFPGGRVTVARVGTGDYWAHITLEEGGAFADARLDRRDKHAGEPDVGDLLHPQAYHWAVRVRSVKAHR